MCVQVLMDVYFMSTQKTRPSLFGTPIIIPRDENTTCQDLYHFVWVQVSRLVSPLPPNEQRTTNHAQDWSVCWASCAGCVLCLSLATVTVFYSLFLDRSVRLGLCLVKLLCVLLSLLHTSTHMYICMHACTHTLTHSLTLTHTHTHTHTHIFLF